MSQLKELLDREARRIGADPDALESTLRLRDRKRRRQRISAGVIGVTVFLAAVSVATSGGSSAPGPTSVGSEGTDAGPTRHPSFPPEGALPSMPRTGDVIAHHSWRGGYLFAYADGRVLWYTRMTGPPVYERRLTREAVDLVQSGAIRPADLSPYEQNLRTDPSAWEDADAKPYVPFRYAICGIPLSSFPSAAADILRGTERMLLDAAFGGRRECFDISLEETLSIVETLELLGADVIPILPHGAFAGGAGG